MLVVSFIALGALWKTPQLEQHATGRPLGETFSRLVLQVNLLAHGGVPGLIAEISIGLLLAGLRLGI